MRKTPPVSSTVGFHPMYRFDVSLHGDQRHSPFEYRCNDVGYGTVSHNRFLSRVHQQYPGSTETGWNRFSSTAKPPRKCNNINFHSARNRVEMYFLSNSFSVARALKYSENEKDIDG